MTCVLYQRTLNEDVSGQDPTNQWLFTGLLELLKELLPVNVPVERSSILALFVAMPGAPSSVPAPSSKARSS